MEMNFVVILLTSLVPMVMGFIWYNPKTLGAAWMQAAGVTEEKMKGANMGLIFGLSFLFSVMLAMAVNGLVIHQNHMYSILLNEPGFGDPNSELGQYIAAFMEKYGNNFRTFKHGALHGFLGGLFFAFPILATNAMFERKGWKYIWINTGYWTITLTLMGGILCAYNR
ncbi:MAG: DUF1761 domain-containing protein [Bacteroidetes bacterium]|nr:MAG: DUF1761 domain-containing protein [Bacteroidota bacterium]